MIDDELDQEEVDAIDDEGDEIEVFDAGPDRDEPEDINEQDEPPVSKGAGKPSADVEELPSIEEKQKEREALERAMEEFLARGGKIQSLDPEKN